MAEQKPLSDQSNAVAAPKAADSADDATVRERVIRLAFAGDRERYDEFVRALRDAIPPDVSVVLRGSAVTGTRWEDGAPFDSDGPGTSDLDLTMIGGDMVKHFDVFYIPGLHSVPLGDAHPDASVTFVPLRKALHSIAQRPVTIQATSDFVQFLRDRVMNQPYFTIIAKQDTDEKMNAGTS
jgi:hypothetical protein